MRAVRPRRKHSVTMREGFDWPSVVWHDVLPFGRLTCSYCRSELLLCELQHIIGNDDGRCAVLCESCVEEWLSE